MINNKQVQHVNKLLKKQIVQKYGMVALALLVVGAVAAFGTNLKNFSQAAAVPATLSLSPPTGTGVTGSNLTVTVFEDSTTDTVNAVQAALNYNAAQLQFVSMAEGTAFPTVAATSTSTPGVIRVGRATQAPNSVSGRNAVVTITFKVLASSGTANITFDPAFSFVVRSTDNVNVLGTTAGSTFTLRQPTPTITSVSPASGPIAGGTPITITGTNFVSGATVNIGGTAATNVAFVSPTTLTATTAAHAAGTSNIIVTNPDGQSVTRAAAYTYIAPAPVVSSISPASGTTLGGTAVAISGSNFQSGASVTLGGTAVATVTFVSSSSLTVVTPARAAGAVSLVVTNPDQQATDGTTFTYVLPVPTISAVSPSVGPTSGGTTLTITGSNLSGITGVTIGGVAATNRVVTSTTSMTVITPAHTAGLVDVVVTNTSGSATKSGAFTYTAPPPLVSSISPNVGTASGGTSVTITGSNFVSGASVSFGGVAATSVTFVSATMLIAKAPAHTSGLANVVVTNPGGQSSTLSGGFTFLVVGDANNDGRVNAIDLSILLSHDGQNYAAADFNGDGTVGSADMAILLGRWTW